MKNRRLIILFSLLLLVSLLIVSVMVLQNGGVNKVSTGNLPSVYVGVDVPIVNLINMEKLIDQVSSYVNLIIIGSVGITYTSQLNDACQYIYSKGLYFIFYTDTPPSLIWLQDAAEKWGNHFLGLYAFDELGGKQLDRDRDWMLVPNATNYTAAANVYESQLNSVLHTIRKNYSNSTNVPLFTSDYAFYWFDYGGGYNTVFAEFAENYSRQLSVELCRGAAESQNKTWGVMITYTYSTSPYIESATTLYDDMVYAYSNGAKYIVVFDSNPNWTQPVLDQTRLAAMKHFWNYMNGNPKVGGSISADTAYLLPQDYAYGFRGPNDWIWGLWGPDNLTVPITTQLYGLMQQYGNNLNVVYDGSNVNFMSQYNRVICWNGTTYSR